MHGAKLIIVLLLTLCLVACENSSKPEDKWLQTSIDESLAALESEPGNCVALNQVAAGYQVQRQFQPAIAYFEKLMDHCPDNYSSRFQLGICYLFVNDPDKAVLTMDRAISDARKLGDSKWADAYEKEKVLWLKSFAPSSEDRKY